jgi:hypothetical protein
MASLTGTKIKDTYDGLLKTTDNGVLGASVKLITDGLGNSSGVYLSTSGDVGIGASTPLAKAHVKSGSSGFSGSLSSNYDDLAIEASGNAGITILSPNSNNCGIAFADEDANFQGLITYRHSLDLMSFSAGGTERMRLDSSANLGVGTTTVTANLDLAADDIVNGVTLRLKNVHNGSDWALDSKLGVIDFYSTDASAVGVKGSIELIQSSASASNPSATDLVFKTYGGGSISEKMRITSGGDVYIGTGSNPASSTQGGASFVSDTNDRKTLLLSTQTTSNNNLIIFYNTNGAVGNISTSGSSTAYNTSSDYRLKEDWQPMEGALDRVDALKPVNFAWKASGDRVDGFLAHELAEVVPEAVTGEKDAVEEYEVTPAVIDEEGNVIEEAVMGTRPVYQGIDQSKIVPLLVAAIQELRAEIKALKA